MPCAASCSAGPMPDSISRCGDPIAPADSTTPKRARSSVSAPPRRTSTPVARPSCTTTRSAIASLTTVRFGRDSAGTRYARAAETRRCPRRVCWNVEKPSRRGPFMSAFTGRPIASAAAANSSQQVGRLGQVFDRLRAVGAAALAAAGEGFVPHEIRQQVVPPPARAALLRPEVVVRRMPAHMPEPVDRRRPAPDPPARIIQRPPARRGIRLGAEPPGQRADDRGCAHSRPGCGYRDGGPARRPR